MTRDSHPEDWRRPAGVAGRRVEGAAALAGGTGSCRWRARAAAGEGLRPEGISQAESLPHAAWVVIVTEATISPHGEQPETSEL